MELFKLFGSIFIDNDKANESISKTDKKAKGLGETFSKGIKNVGKFGVAVASFGAVAVAGAGVALVGLANKAGQMSDRLLDLNSITGMSTDEIQKWEQASVVAGVSADAMTNASQNLTRAMDIITTTGGKGAEAIESLGLSVDEISKMNADERINVLSEALAGVDDKTTRAKLGTDLFKGSWKEIAPIMDLSVEGMKKAKDSANIISEDNLIKANNFRISMDEMKKKVEVLGMELAIKFLPIAEQLFSWFEKAMPYLEIAVKKTFDIIGKAIEFVVPIIEKFANYIKDNLSPIIEKFQNSSGENFEKIKKVINEVVDFITKNILPVLVEYFNLIKDDIIPSVVEAIKEWWPIIADIINETWQLIKAIFDKWKIYFDFVWPYFKDIVMVAIDKIIVIVSGLLTVLKGAIQFITGVLTGDWEKAWEGIKTIFIGIFNTIKGYFKEVIDWIADKVNWVIEKVDKAKQLASTIKNTASNIGSSIISGAKNIASNIPGLAEGGTIKQGGSVIVGEKAPELLTLPRGARVTPLEKTSKSVNLTINNPLLLDQNGIDIVMGQAIDRLRMLGVT